MTIISLLSLSLLWSLSFLELVAVDGFTLQPGTTPRNQYQDFERLYSSSSLSSSSSSSPNTGSDGDEVQKLRDKAARLRQEIAQLEGKTVEQVAQEAQEKKDAKRAADQQLQDLKGNNGNSNSDGNSNKGKTNTNNINNIKIDIPQDADSMIFQAARAIEMAYRDGITRQTIRLALVAVDEGKASFSSATSLNSFRELNPWPGGAQQMYREAAKPLTTALLSELNPVSRQLYQELLNDQDPKRQLQLQQQQALRSLRRPKVVAQDIWDFDGSAVVSAQAQDGPESDVQALVFANTDLKYIQDIATIDTAMGNRLFLLVNPFWRNVDSWGFNILAPGAKTKAQATIFDQGFDETYVYLRFSVRGEDCAAIKCYPYDWQIFAYREDDSGWETPVRLGSSKTEPKSDFITQLLNERPEFKLTRALRQMKK